MSTAPGTRDSRRRPGSMKPANARAPARGRGEENGSACQAAGGPGRSVGRPVWLGRRPVDGRCALLLNRLDLGLGGLDGRTARKHLEGGLGEVATPGR